jgi:hypothetical protein
MILTRKIVEKYSIIFLERIVMTNSLKGAMINNASSSIDAENIVPIGSRKKSPKVQSLIRVVL